MLRFVRRSSRSFTARAAAALSPYQGVTARLLYARGIETAAQAEAFLHPSLDALHSPMLLHDMDKAVAILTDAKQRQLPVVVYGDYDADGICAASLLTLALRRYGLNVSTYTPLRAEGYGLNCAAVKKLAQTQKVLVTVDLGITNHEEVRLAQSLGMTVIVTDHHQLPPEQSPADACINPLLGDYPFRYLCGTGVAFKLSCALLGLESCMDFLDLAALATIADIVPLQDENRILVLHGLKRIERRDRVGIKALMAVSGDPEKAEADFVSFQLAPRLNAAGRLDDAAKGVRLLTTDDETLAQQLSDELNEFNTRRKGIEAEVLKGAEAQAAQSDLIRHPALILKGEGWHMGVVGLAAGKLCEKYSCPTCVLSEENGILHGSLRSVEGVHIHKCLLACDDLLMRYGGHAQAAGVTLESANFPAFFERLQGEIANCDPECFLPTREYDTEIALSECTDKVFREIQLLAPFGCGNPTPLFLSKNLIPEEYRTVGVQGTHLKLTLRDGDRLIDGIAFGQGAYAREMPSRVDAIFELNLNTFRGITSLQMQVKGLRAAEGAMENTVLAESNEAFGRALLDFLLEESRPQAGKETNRAEYTTQANETQLQMALERKERGHVLIAHTKETLLHALSLGQADLVRASSDDPRGFASLVMFPSIAKTQSDRTDVWLMDGELLAQEASLWHEKLPNALIHISPISCAVHTLARSIDAGDDSYRTLYKLLRRNVWSSLDRLSHEAELTQVQTLVGLNAFSQLGLIEFSPSPFRITLLPPQKCSLGDSAILSAIRHLSQNNT